MAFSASRGERDPLLLVNSSSSNIREEKSALESFRKKRESSLRNKEKFTEEEEEEEEEVNRPNKSVVSNNNKTIHDIFAHSAVFILVLFSAFFAFVCVGFVHRSHYIRAKENALVRAMNADMLEETLMKNTNELVPLSVFLKTSESSGSLSSEEEEDEDEDGRRKDALFAEKGKRRKKEEKVETTKYSNGKSFARTILTKEEVKPFEKWLAKDGEIELDKLVEALRADKETLYEK